MLDVAGKLIEVGKKQAETCWDDRQSQPFRQAGCTTMGEDMRRSCAPEIACTCRFAGVSRQCEVAAAGLLSHGMPACLQGAAR